MKVHYRLFRIDGLNIDPLGFNWKNRLAFTNSRLPDKHTATAYVKIPRPFSDPIYRDGFSEHGKDLQESFRLLSIFFACYGLANNQYLPKIDMTGSSGHEIEEDQFSLDNLHFWIGIENPSGYGTMSIEQTMQCLNNTVPLFDKVMKILENKKDHKLDVALIMYYRSAITFESMEAFTDSITALEALYLENANSYKLALRASIFTETDYSMRREIFDGLREAYQKRNDFVHGDDVSLGVIGDYQVSKFIVSSVLKKSLLNYIELAFIGKKKSDIIKYIEDIALGLKR